MATNTTAMLDPRTSPTAQPGYVLNPNLGAGSTAYYQDTAVSALAYKWATATPEERSTFLGDTWVTAQYGSPDATDGVDANGRVYTSPQTILALTKYVQSGAGANDPWVMQNLGPPPTPGANEYIESPDAVAARVAQANSDRAFDLATQQEARLATSDARSAQIASQQIAASQANAAMAAEASKYGSDKQLEGTKYASDQGLKGSVFGTLGQYLSSIYNTQEGNRLGALEAGGNLAGTYQGLLDNRTNRYIDLRSDPSDIVAREYTSRAIMKPEGYEGPLYSDVPELQQALSRLLGWTPTAAPQLGGLTGGTGNLDLNALLQGLNLSGILGGGTGTTGGTSGGGTGTTGGSGAISPTGLNTPGTSNLRWNRSATTALNGGGATVPQDVQFAGPTREQLGGTSTFGDRTMNDSYVVAGGGLNEHTVQVTKPSPLAQWVDGAGWVEPTPYGDDQQQNPVGQTYQDAMINSPNTIDMATGQLIPKAAFGGKGLSHAVVGDPQQPGRPNPEMVVARPGGGFDVLPLNKMPLSVASRVMQNSPKMAYGNVAWNSTQGYYDTTTGQSVAQPGTETTAYEPPPTYSYNSYRPRSTTVTSSAQPTPTQPTPTQPAPTPQQPATTTTPPPPPAQVTPSTATTPVPTTPTPAPVTPTIPAGQLPPGTPPMTSYPDEVYQNLPALQYLLGNMPLSAYNTAQTGLQQGAFGTQVPGLGGLNLARLSEIAKSPESIGTLESLYKSANMNLSDLIARAAARFGAPGTQFRTSQIET